MPKTREQKTKDLEQLKKDLETSQAVVITDYKGLGVNALNELRKKLSQTGATVKIVKNSLLAKANDQIQTTGPSAVIFGFDKVVEPVKALYDFSKATELPKVKLGVLNGEIITEEQVKSLATMPSLQELRAKFLGSLMAPVSGFARVSNGVSANFVRVLNAYKDTKSE